MLTKKKVVKKRPAKKRATKKVVTPNMALLEQLAHKQSQIVEDKKRIAALKGGIKDRDRRIEAQESAIVELRKGKSPLTGTKALRKIRKILDKAGV